MRVTTFVTALVSLFASCQVVDAQRLTLFDNKNFWGFWYDLYGAQPQVCYTLTCFNDRALSAQWVGYSGSGSIAGRSWMVFYTEASCNGRSVAWRADEGSPPANFESDGVPRDISSFMVVNDWWFASRGYVTIPEPARGQCPGRSRRQLLEEPASNNTDTETTGQSAAIDLSVLVVHSSP